MVSLANRRGPCSASTEEHAENSERYIKYLGTLIMSVSVTKRLCGGGLAGLGNLTITMAVASAPNRILEISATTSTNRSSAHSLCRPIETSHLSIRVPARSAALVLDVVRTTVATVARRVVMLTAETETGSTLGH